MFSQYDQIIFHIDVNSAFLSWSAIRELKQGSDRDLRTIPSIVGGDIKTRHGVVLAKSIQAKKYGIKTGEPVMTALKKCPTLVSVPPDHHYYREMSRQLMEFLTGICPVIEQVSVDECYLDYTPIRTRYPSPEEAARIIREGVYKQFGYTVNVGISDRKVLAKMASDFEKPDKTHTLYQHEIQEKMWPLPVGELYMCGRSAAKKLNAMGIDTIGDLALADSTLIEAHLKKHGMLLQRYARGEDRSKVKPQRDRAKGIGHSTTLSSDVRNREEAYQVLKKLAGKVADRLKKQHFKAGNVCTEIKYASFQSVSHQCMLDSETASADRILQTAMKLFDELWSGEPVRLLGIRATRLIEDSQPTQMSFADYEQIMPEIRKTLEEKREREKQEKEEKEKRERERQEKERKKPEREKQDKENRKKKLEAAMNSINSKYGDGAIRKGLSEKLS